MTDNQRENLSAGMDGELSKEALRFLLRRLEHDDSLQQAWSRYHVARDGLRRQLPTLASADFATRVMQAIEQDVVVMQGKRRHWLHWSAGGAIAASVAVAALMIAQPAGSGADRAMPQVASAPSAVSGSGNGMQVARSEAPAVAPPWVNAYADSPYKLSQQASATLDGDNGSLLYSRDSLSAYRLGRPAVSNGDGSYLLLIHPDQAQQPLEQAPDNAQ